MIGAFLSPVLGLARGVPVGVWIVAAALGFGAVQHWRAKSAGAELLAQQAAAAEQREQALKATIAETERRLEAQKGIVHEAQTRSRGVGVAASAARVAGDGLRVAAVAVGASAAASSATAADRGQATRLADVVVECSERYRQVAGVADEAIIAGLACERTYESLTPIAPIKPIEPLKGIP